MDWKSEGVNADQARDIREGTLVNIRTAEGFQSLKEKRDLDNTTQCWAVLMIVPANHWGACFSAIRNLGSKQSYLYGLILVDSSSIFSNFSSSGNAKRQLVALIEFSICSILAKYVK